MYVLFQGHNLLDVLNFVLGGHWGVETHTVKRIAVLAAALAVFVACRSFGQNANSGEIVGQVTDSTGAVITGADVVLVNIGTGITTRTQTNSAGFYDVPSLPTGQYKITFSKTGFRDEVRDGITLQVATVRVNAALQVGEASQQVVVTANVPLLQTEDSAEHIDFNAKAVQNAPIVGGIWYNELTNELPGVNGGGGQAASGQGVGVNGTEGYSGTFTALDQHLRGPPPRRSRLPLALHLARHRRALLLQRNHRLLAHGLARPAHH
jgi:hypothetical protein